MSGRRPNSTCAICGRTVATGPVCHSCRPQATGGIARLNANRGDFTGQKHSPESRASMSRVKRRSIYLRAVDQRIADKATANSESKAQRVEAETNSADTALKAGSPQ